MRMPALRTGSAVFAAVWLGMGLGSADEAWADVTPSSTIDAQQVENLPARTVNDLALLVPISKPVGPFGDVANTGIGIGAQLRHRINDDMSLIFIAGVDRFGSKSEASDREIGAITSEYGAGGLEIEVLRGGGTAMYGNQAIAGVITAIGMTGFDSDIQFPLADASIHFSENAFAVVAGIFYDQPVGKKGKARGKVRGQVTGIHAFSRQGDSRAAISLGWVFQPWKIPPHSDIADRVATMFPQTKFLVGVGPTCNYPSFGRYSNEVAHGFGFSGRVAKDVRLPFGFYNPNGASQNVTNASIFADINKGFLKPALEYDVDGIEEKAGSFSIDIGAQFFVQPNDNVMPFLQTSIGYQTVTNERTSPFAQLPSYDHGESGFNFRGGFGARVAVSSRVAVDLSLDTPIIGLGYKDHTEEPGWSEYKPNETRMKAVLLYSFKSPSL